MNTADDKASDLTPAQADNVLHWVIDEMKKAFAITSGHTFDYDTATLEGLCGFSQTFIDLTLKDYNIGISNPFVIQSLPSYTHNHAATAVQIETTQGPKVFLIDPTFRQFEIDGKDQGAILANLPQGEHMVSALRQQGFIELTPERAHSYLSAFNRGICPLDTTDKIMDFFKNPPTHEHNNWFSRQKMKEFGVKNL